MAKGKNKKRDFKPSTDTTTKPEDTDDFSTVDRGIDFQPSTITTIGPARPGTS